MWRYWFWLFACVRAMTYYYFVSIFILFLSLVRLDENHIFYVSIR